MKKSSTSAFDHQKIIGIFIFLLLPIGLACNVNLIAPLIDSFHEGEYIGNLRTMHDYHAGVSGFPLLIHGAMDYLPALLAEAIAGTDRILVWTRFLNVLATAVCWVLYLDMSRVIMREHPARHLWTTVFLLLFIWMAVSTGEDPVRKQQAFLGTRDIFLMLSLWAGTKAIHAQKSAGTYAGLITSGLSAGMSFYWSYDRGILAAVFIAGFALALLFQRRRGAAAAVLLACVTALVAAAHTTVVGSLQENVSNVIYWIQNTGDVWFIAFRSKRIALLGAFAMAMLAVATIWHTLLKTRRTGAGTNFPLVVGLILIQLVYLTKLYSLPGFPISYYFIWPTFLLWLLVPPSSAMITGITQSLHELLARVAQARVIWKKEDKAVIWGAGILVLMLSSNSLVGVVLSAKNLYQPVPDRSLIESSHYALDALPKTAASCVFQWSNEGVFSFVLKKPFCTKYGYAVYIAQNHEAAALKELISHPPGLIVYDSPYWSMSIYGRHMRDRLPAIDRFIRENYVFHQGGNGYVFATLKPQKAS